MRYKVVLVAQKTDAPPLGLGYLKAYTEKYLGTKKVDIQIITLERLDEIVKREMFSISPDLIGFSCYDDPEIFVDICAKVKKKFKDTITLLGGPTITYSYYDKIKYKNSVDFIILGEGEIPFLKLLCKLINKEKDFSNIKRLVYIKNNKPIFSEITGDLIKDVNEIPSPYLTGALDIKGYLEFIVEESRGCLYNCSYCGISNKFLGYREFNINRIFKEINFLIKKVPNIRGIDFAQSDAFINFNRGKKLIEYIKKLNITFHLEINVAKLNSNVIELLSVPNIDLGVGVQTLTKDALIKCNRFQYPDIKLLEKWKNKIFNKGNFNYSLIYGLPGDNHNSFIKSIEFFLKNESPIYIYKLRMNKNSLFDLNKNRYKIIFSKRYPYYVLSNYTYTKKEIQKTENLLGEIGKIKDFAEKISTFSYLLNKISECIDDKYPCIKTYQLFALYIKENKSLEQIIDNLNKFSKYNYQVSNEWIYSRETLFYHLIKFIQYLKKENKSILKENYKTKLIEMINFLKKINLRFILKENINKYWQELEQNENILNFHIIKWLDFTIRSNKIINVIDRFCDKTLYDSTYPFISLDEIGDKFEINYENLICLGIFSWLSKKQKQKFIKNRKRMYVIDILDKSDLILLNSVFKKSKICKIDNMNIYIFQR